jgi:hypothetical protein
MTLLQVGSVLQRKDGDVRDQSKIVVDQSTRV